MRIQKTTGRMGRFQKLSSWMFLCLLSSFYSSTILIVQSQGAAPVPPKSLQNGFYAVLLETQARSEALCEGSSCTVLPYDKKYSDSDMTEPVKYVVLDTSTFVPLIIEGAPDAKKDATGKTILGVTLKKEYVPLLEVFSRAHLGGRVAIALEGEIITLHKVRSVISGGQLQITRCTDNACEILKAKLTK